MAGDESTPTEPQEAASEAPVNNPGPDPANESGGSPGVLSNLYDTLGTVQAGLDVRREEAEDAKKKLLEQEQTLLEQRAQAEQADDTDAFDAITAKLDELREAWGVLSDDTEEPDAESESEDGDADGDERGRGGDDRGAGDGERAVAGADDRGELRGGADGGPPDDQQ